MVYHDPNFYDLGYVTPHPNPKLPGWTANGGQPISGNTNQDTWRDSWLEHCIWEVCATIAP